MTKKRAKNRPRQFWTRLVDEYESGPSVTQRSFAESHGVKLQAFRRWLYKLRRERASKQLVRRPAGFVEVELPDMVTAPLVRVRVADVSVEFDTLPPPAWVAELVARREAGSC